MWVIYSALKAAIESKRTCPACGKVNAINYGARFRTVKCTRCGRSLPAPKDRI